MTDRRNFLVFMSLGGALAALNSTSSSGQQPSLPSPPPKPSDTIHVPKVVEISKLRRALARAQKERFPVIDYFNLAYRMHRIGASECENCGCNSVCGCNEDNGDCTNKCACHSKNSSKANLAALRKSEAYQMLVSTFNPDEIKTFDEVMDILPQIGFFSDPIRPGEAPPPLGVDDKGPGLKVGEFNESQLRQFFRERDRVGRRIPPKFFYDQFKSR
jgi:hypothetical protein